VIAILAVSILIQVHFNSELAYLMCTRWLMACCINGTKTSCGENTAKAITP
jgi:hypothetical protein